MRAYVRLLPAYAPYISSNSLHMHHGAYAGSECIYTYIYIECRVSAYIVIYPIGDLEYLVKYWTVVSKLCFIYT